MTYDDVMMQSGFKTIVKISSLYLQRLQKKESGSSQIERVSGSQLESFFFECRIKLNDLVDSWNSYKTGLS